MDDITEKFQQQVRQTRADATTKALRELDYKSRTNASIIGYDADLGLNRVRLPDGTQMYAAPDTNGVQGTGDNVLFHQGEAIAKSDTNPAVRQLARPNRSFVRSKEIYPFKVLFSIYSPATDVTSLYVGGDRQKPEKILELIGLPLFDIATISNTQLKKPNYIVGLRHGAITQSFGVQHTWEYSSLQSRTTNYKGHGVWVSPLIRPVLEMTLTQPYTPSAPETRTRKYKYETIAPSYLKGGGTIEQEYYEGFYPSFKDSRTSNAEAAHFLIYKGQLLRENGSSLIQKYFESKAVPPTPPYTPTPGSLYIPERYGSILGDVIDVPFDRVGVVSGSIYLNGFELSADYENIFLQEGPSRIKNEINGTPIDYKNAFADAGKRYYGSLGCLLVGADAKYTLVRRLNKEREETQKGNADYVNNVYATEGEYTQKNEVTYFLHTYFTSIQIKHYTGFLLQSPYVLSIQPDTSFISISGGRLLTIPEIITGGSYAGTSNTVAEYESLLGSTFDDPVQLTYEGVVVPNPFLSVFVGTPIVISQTAPNGKYWTAYGEVSGYNFSKTEEIIIFKGGYYNYKTKREVREVNLITFNINKVELTEFDSMATENGTIWSNNGSILPFVFCKVLNDTPQHYDHLLDTTDPNLTGSFYNSVFTEEMSCPNNLNLVGNKIYIAKPLSDGSKENVAEFWEVASTGEFSRNPKLVKGKYVSPPPDANIHSISYFPPTKP